MKKLLIFVLLLSVAEAALAADWCNFPTAATVLEDFVFPTKDCVTPGSKGESVTAADLKAFVHEPDVGIGTTAPATPLHVATGEDSLPSINAVTGLLVQNNAAAGDGSIITILSGNTGNAQLFFGDTDDERAGRFSYQHATDILGIHVDNGEVAALDGSGNLVLDGDVEATGLIAFCSPPVSAVACTPNQLCADDSFIYHCNAAGTAYSRVAISTW